MNIDPEIQQKKNEKNSEFVKIRDYVERNGEKIVVKTSKIWTKKSLLKKVFFNKEKATSYFNI